MFMNDAMKKNTFMSILLMIPLTMVAQQGYWVEGKFVELCAGNSPIVFVQAQNDGQNFVEELTVMDSLYVRIAENRFLLSKENAGIIEGKGGYISFIYNTTCNTQVIVLPEIIISLYEKENIISILKQYNKVLTLKKVIDNSTFVLSSNCKYSSEVLNFTEQLSKSDGVKWCEPDMLSDIRTYNSLYSQQYYLRNTGQNNGTSGIDINVEPAWGLIAVSSNITVAVIDQGVERNHPDLTCITDSGYTAGYPLEIGEPKNDNYLDCKGHGVSCAGIIAASDNTIGIKGVASGIKVLPVNIFPYTPEIRTYYQNGLLYQYNYYGAATYEEIAEAIEWAYPKADILSCSWGNMTTSNRITQAITKARNYGRGGKGCVIAFSSGNNYPTESDISFPANVEGVLAVGAVDKNGTIWSYSQRGDSIKIVAPSGNINLQGDVVTTDRVGNNGYSSSNYTNQFGGTSAACPQVAGVAALMLSANPDLSEDKVRLLLQMTAKDLGATGFDTTYGYGLVDAYAAVKAALMSINGSSVVCGTQTYYVSGLPTGMSVSWSLTFNSGNSAQLATNTPATNQCQVTRTASTPFSATLTATITYQGQTIKTLTKALSGNIPIAMSFYTYGTTQGGGGLPHTFASTNYISLLPNTYYYVTSPRLPGMTLVPFFPVGSSGYVMQRVSETEIMVCLPPSGFMTVAATGSNCDNFSFAFAASSSKSYALDISGDGEQMRASLVPDTEDLNARNAGQEEENVNWTLEVYETTKAELTATQKVEGLSCTLDTSRWKPGLYIVRALVGDETLTEKINLK